MKITLKSATVRERAETIMKSIIIDREKIRAGAVTTYLDERVMKKTSFWNRLLGFYHEALSREDAEKEIQTKIKSILGNEYASIICFQLDGPLHTYWSADHLYYRQYDRCEMLKRASMCAEGVTLDEDDFDALQL